MTMTSVPSSLVKFSSILLLLVASPYGFLSTGRSDRSQLWQTGDGGYSDSDSDFDLDGHNLWRNDKTREEHRQPVVEYYRFGARQYLLFSQKVTWEEARMLCSYYNSKLAVLDSMEKAANVAGAIADSNIAMEDGWLGGRRSNLTWRWIDDGSSPMAIPMESNLEDYPPWGRRPNRPTKECLAIGRRSHSQPNFLDLDCRLQRAFVCEKKAEQALGKPVPSRWVSLNGHGYTLYHARVTWQEAAQYCRSLGSRLAILKNLAVVEILDDAMTRTRPDFESVWIGAYHSHGQWVWMATGAALSEVTGADGYPPWRNGRPQRQTGCLLLDRHMENVPSFVEVPCNRKRDFVCEEYPEDEEQDWLKEPVRFAYDRTTYILYPQEKSWEESRRFCQATGSVLAYVDDLNDTNLIVEAMGDHPKGISHVWMGARRSGDPDDWRWVHNGRELPRTRDSTGFPPWATGMDEQLDYHATSSRCLNLDRSDYVKPHLYGLDCSSEQPFVCKITCEVQPLVRNGSWTCEDTRSGKKCRIGCDKGFISATIRNASCSYRSGWSTGQTRLEVPLCLEPKDHAARIMRALEHDLRQSVGYYIIVDHANEKIRGLSMLFIERILNAFSISRNLRMGLICMATRPLVHLPLNQTDYCRTLDTIRSMKKNLSSIDDGASTATEIIHRDLWRYKDRKIVTIAIIDAIRGAQYADILARMKSIGHQVVIVGMEDDWEFLLPLSSIGSDRRRSLYLFDTPDFNNVIREMSRFGKQQTVTCKTTGEDVDRDILPKLGESTTLSTISVENRILSTTSNRFEDETHETSEIPPNEDNEKFEIKDPGTTYKNVMETFTENPNDFTEKEYEEELTTNEPQTQTVESMPSTEQIEASEITEKNNLDTT